MSGHSQDRTIAGRKLQHLRALRDDPKIERHGAGFEQIALTHRALPELDLDAVRTGTSFMGKSLDCPLLISSMTGGADPQIAQINRNLALAAQEAGVALAVGSQRVMFADDRAEASFCLRQYAPDIPLFANIGAVQLNDGLTIEHCRRAVEVLDADGLYLHLNPLQEAVQPEGDRDFSGLSEKIARIAEALAVPVLLKEVGAGLSRADVELGLAAGIRHFDVAGRGGTSWSRIEYHRRSEQTDDLGLIFQDWGLTTVESLIELRPVLQDLNPRATLIASGGIRNGIDMAKSLILGADLCGIAAPFLAAAQQSAEKTVSAIQKFQRELQVAMFLLGCADINALQGNISLIRQKGN